VTTEIDSEAAPSAAPAAVASSVRFEIRSGVHLVRCIVSDEALDAVSGLLDPSTPALRRRSFDRFRTLIHEAALIQHQARSPVCVDPILVTSADLRRVPPRTGLPKFGTFGRESVTGRPTEVEA